LKQFSRFVAVGVANTLVDVAVFSTLRMAGMNLLFANTISTSLALATSLLLNSKYTFKQHDLSIKKIVIYVTSTLVGVWALQPVIIYSLEQLQKQVDFTVIASFVINDESLRIFIITKLIAIGFTLFWNYFWYSRVVFKPLQKSEA
jgi:putative flippase GtrA